MNSRYRSTSNRSNKQQLLTQKQPLEIIPSEVVFKDIQINQYYEITIEIRNLTQHSTRIRIPAPSSPALTVHYVMQAEIAPGLSTIAKVKYECKQLKNQTETIKIVSQQGFTVQLPVRVYKMQSQILFEPFINMGFLRVGKEHIEQISVKNSGRGYSVVDLEAQAGSSGMIVEPKQLRIAPMQISKIFVKYKPTQAGIFKGIIKLKSDSILVKDQIDIHATPVDFARFIVDDKGNQTLNFDFGTLFTGHECILKGFIVNNSPKKMKFKSFFRKGYLSNLEQFALVQTPSEIGQQQSERVMFIQPEYGQIEPFTQFELKVICNTRITYRDKIFTKNYALSDSTQQGAINQMKNATDFKPENLHEYSALINIEDDEPMIVQLRANAICPLIKISNNTFKFGDCSVKQNRQLEFEVENKNEHVKAEISFPKIPNFYVSPSVSIIRPRQTQTFKAIFEPKTIGKLDTNQLIMINKLYQLDLRFFGICTSGSSKSRLKQQQAGKIVKDSPKKIQQPLMKTRGKAFSLTDKTFMSQMRKSTQQEEKMKIELSNLMQNRSKYNQYLNDKRTERFDKQKDEKVQKRWSLYQSKLKDLGIASKLEQKVDDEGLVQNPPIDFEFETGMIDTKIAKQKINLPEAKQRLYVTRHISDYQPLPVSNSNAEKFYKQFKEAPKKLWPQTPTNYNHKREIGMQLNAEQLSQIQVASNTINFGQVYIKSISKGYFWIRNGTKKTISVLLKFKDNQLQQSNKSIQVIPSCSEAGFAIAFNRDTLGDFRSNIQYVINGQHQFQMSVTAKCVPVNIEVDRPNLKFSFDENSLQMSTKQVIKLTNPGNSQAVFKFTLGKQRLFLPSIVEGRVKAKQTLEIPISFTAPQPKSQKSDYAYNERLVLKILDGSECSILCSCHLSDPKFTIKPLTTPNPTLCVDHQFTDFIQIKNTSKYPIIFHIEGQVIEINEKVKVNPDEVRKFRVRYIAKEIGEFTGQISVKPRSGISKLIQAKITVVKPKLWFEKEEIDMGILVVQGISGIAKMKLKNTADIEMPLIIDLRPRHIKDTNPQYIENLNIKLINSDQQLQVMAPTMPAQIQDMNIIQGQNLVDMQVNEDELENSQADEEEIVQKNEEEYRRFRLLLKPNKQYEFDLQFFPKDVKNYEIQIPMMIEGSNAIIDNLPAVICEGIKPQFIFQPSVVDFKRKIVTKPERSYPKYMTITISNIDDVQVEWQLKDFQIRKQGIFTIQQNCGLLKPKQTIEVRASFNPFTVSQYFHKMPLYIKNSKLSEPLKYVDVIFKGVSSLPNLFFNKRQVILPVVPLDIETTSTFRLLNDGYENCNLKYQFIDDVADLGVKVLFPEGTNIGITRQKLKVDLVWKYHKPISFCLKLQFIDDLNRSFIVPISGTADNCIFTNYTYFLRNQNKFTIKPQGTLQLAEIVEPSTTLVRKNSAHSIRSNVTGRSIMSYLGVNPISPAILSNTINYINRYLNANLLTNPIKDFPGSFIESDGQQIFEILAFVSSKTQNFPWRYNPVANQKPLVKMNRLFNQYNQLIKLLKIEGAHLNHIRPEYLLSFSDLNLYLSNLPEEKSKFYMPSLLKINSGLYNYLSLQSWITLLYQVFKIYILARVSAKNFKSHLPKIPEPPKYYLQTSNFASSSESLLFYWVENAILQILLEQRRLTNFDKDFKDGIAIGALLQKYAGVNVLKKMKMVCTMEQDYKDNAVVVCEGLKQIGMLNHISPKDISNPLQREMLLFILHLYVYLPFYVPKQEPVVFKCILGEEVIRTIELTNPSNKPVTYSVKYEGSQDFKMLSDDKFRIEPKQVYKYQVKFVSRVSASVKGKIMFINVKENSLTAAALVFELQSDIVGRTSDRIWNISGILYEQVEFPIEVYNKFTSAEMVDFAITYQTQYIFESRPKNKNAPLPLPKEQQMQTIFGKQESVKIRKGGTITLTLNYVPMAYYTTKTTIFFLNPIIGEFQHEIIASVEPPGTTAEIRPPMNLSVDQIVNWQYSLNPKNEQVTRAKKAIESLKKTKKGPGSKQNPTQQKTQNPLGTENFIVEIAPNPYITAKENIKISDRKQERKSKEQIVDNENKIPFTIICKNPVYEFTTYVLVHNKTKTDVRRFKVVFTVQPKPLKAILEMTVPARGQVTQNLPIVNNTERDWNIKVQWQPDSSKNGNYFIVPSQYTSSFPVKRNSIGSFPITFKPKWANDAEAKLTLINPLTLDHFEYQIVGKGEQPLAEEHIEIKCEAKQIVKKQIIVKNPYTEKPVTLNVQTDLINCKAPKKLTIPSGGKQKLQFTVQPMLCGQYTGSITLFEEEGSQYIWYTVSIITNYPEAYKSLNISSEIRQKVLTEIHVPFEHNEQSSFQVVINGNGLVGDPTCTMKPNYDNTYLLEYLPLQVGEQKGSVCFINPGVGQVLFQLNLNCSNKAPVIINNLKSPLGVSTTVFAEIENPTHSKTIVKVHNTNPEQFVIKSHTIRLQAQEKKKIEIQYVPASLDVIQQARIQFVSKDIGSWRYELSGSGQMPVPFNPYNVYNGLYEEHSDAVKFKNPFKYEIVVGVKLVQQSQKGIFKIMAHGKTKFQIDMGGILQIPFSFVPNSCKLFTCKILVMISEKIYWTFPIRGVTEVNEGKVIASLSSPCRQTTSEFVQIGLEGVQYSSKNNLFECSFENIPAQYQKQIEKALLVQLAKDNLKHAKDNLQIEFMFKPMKPIKVSFDLLITKKEGSRWRYKIILEGTEPEPDDIISIQSNLLVTSTVAFKITNTEKASVNFKAKFTSDSAHQFSIEPKQGMLSPFGSKGTPFYVSYTPVEYGKQKKGKLIIETADMYWSYLLKGSLPKYVPPKLEGSRSRISSIRK